MFGAGCYRACGSASWAVAIGSGSEHYFYTRSGHCIFSLPDSFPDFRSGGPAWPGLSQMLPLQCSLLLLFPSALSGVTGPSKSGCYLIALTAFFFFFF